MMQLGDVADTTVPKLTMVSPPTGTGRLSTRTFIPHRCHEAIGVLGAVSVATAALLPGTPAAEVLAPSPDADSASAAATSDDAQGTMILEHPTGTFEAAVTLSFDDAGNPVAERSGIIRTARKLMDGIAFPGPDHAPAAETQPSQPATTE
jgi:4-oxalomesaconate tautomerase